MKERIKRLLFGGGPPQEYVCIGLREFDAQMQITANWIGSNQTFLINENHLLLGYKPLIIGIKESLIGSQDKGEKINLAWLSGDNQIAMLQLQLENTINCGEDILCIFRGMKGTHKFIKKRYQWAFHLKELIFPRPSSNLPLKGNLYDQVRIAYAFPRQISLISISRDDKMNMFPTDLNGPVNQNYYMLSLRAAGKAYEQLSGLGKCLVAQMDASQYDLVYSMGKNHMQEMKPVQEFGIQGFSPNLRMPIPPKMTEYRELSVSQEFQMGIHKLLLCEIMNQYSQHEGEQNTLAHIHNFYLRWLNDQGVTTSVLLR